jgi:hypothetical protein
MSLFSFADIIFSPGSNARGTTDLLDGKEARYGYQILKYPSDLGSADKGHYMVIHINQQNKTQFGGQIVSGESPTVFQNRINNKVQSSVDFSNFQGLLDKTLKGVNNSIKDFTGENSSININLNQFSKSLARTIVRTTDTIALYMPDSLAFNYTQRYETPSLNGILPMAVAAGSSLIDSVKKEGGEYADKLKSAVGNLAPFAANYFLRNSSAFANVLATSVFGVVQNPMLEVIYSSPDFRQFRFDFFFYPRSEKEAYEVQMILERLRFHQAPEIAKESSGFFLVPPSEFDLKFYYNGKENPNIPTISTCVLENIDLDYAPNGFSAYEVPGESTPSLGRTGMPVAIRMSLQFRETEYLTKANFNAKTQKSRGLF